MAVATVVPTGRTARAPLESAPGTRAPRASRSRAPRAPRIAASHPRPPRGGPRTARQHSPPWVGTQSATRDSRGRIRRSASARHEFVRRTGYPLGRPGYVIDHVVPLACGRADAPTCSGRRSERPERRTAPSASSVPGDVIRRLRRRSAPRTASPRPNRRRSCRLTRPRDLVITRASQRLWFVREAQSW